ncbi:MAG: DUF1592 domain-containing protein [Planctomycetaceae bacterium]|nr:DUF1592 domain-containing protein [Planctomycetaceae bacterium]
MKTAQTQQTSSRGWQFSFPSILFTSILFAWLLFTGISRASAQSTKDYGLDLIKTECLDCHSGSESEGELDLASVLNHRPLVENLTTWRNIAQRIRLGDMPPPDEGILKAAKKQKFENWFQTSIEQFDYNLVTQPGYTPPRRLTHSEYRHTIRDLIGVDLADTAKFPQDLSGSSGFKNSANTLFLQGSLFEKYSQSAESIMAAVFAENASPLMELAKSKILASGKTHENIEDQGSAILQDFCRRAFRRPATTAEIKGLQKLFLNEFSDSQQFETAIQKTLTAVLVMPQFLLKIESATKGSTPELINDFDLASRLSYFLWASMPDEELFQLAEQGRLSKPEVLQAQIDRMLKNRRSKTLGYVFGGQWLGFEDVGIRRRQDPIDNPWCTESLMTAMRAESALFLHSLIRNDRPLSELINARYTFLNEELANHYRIRGITGEAMRKVNLKTQLRGGILTQASVLSITAFPDRTSPVVRGHWVLDTILGTPPPEPPPNVSEISEQVLERDDLSFREKVQQHSNNVNCKSCHQEMDPIGFSLENYDNFGRYRTRQFGMKIDASGQLPDGTQFEGSEQLKNVLVSQRLPNLTRQVSEKMLTYALGRQLEYYDEQAIRTIVMKTTEDDYRFQTLIKSVINSQPFLYRQLPEAASDEQ